MATREALVDHLWDTVINPVGDPATLGNVIANCRRQPDAPFSQVGAAIERALAAGVSAEDLCLIQHGAAYEAVFGTLHAIGDPGVDGDEVFGLYESLLTSPRARW